MARRDGRPWLVLRLDSRLDERRSFAAPGSHSRLPSVTGGAIRGGVAVETENCSDWSELNERNESRRQQLENTLNHVRLILKRLHQKRDEGIRKS